MVKWISVKDRLPDKDYLYLVYVHPPKNEDGLQILDDFEEPIEWGYVTLANYNLRQGGIWEMEFDHAAYGTNLNKINTNEEYYISHWMPIPEKPEE